MALNPVGSGASIALTTDTANTTSSIAQKANTLRVVLVGADAVQGAHVAIGTDASATTSDFYIVKNEPASINIFRPSSQTGSWNYHWCYNTNRFSRRNWFTVCSWISC